MLVTGAAGFIGSHLCERLNNDGHNVYGIDNFSTGNNWIEGVKMHPGCITHDKASVLYEFANEAQPELIIHCAASYSDPNKWHRDTDTNVTGTINATLVAKHHGARLIYFQTALPPISSYAISKIAGEQYITLSDVPSLIFRLANIYGPRNLSGPIPTFYKRLVAGQSCTVTNTRRDFVYVGDLVDLVMRAIEDGATGKYDVCSGRDYPISQLWHEVHNALDVEAEIPKVQESATDDVDGMDLDSAKTVYRFSWTPQTPLAEGIPKAVEWYRENGVGDTYTHLALKG